VISGTARAGETLSTTQGTWTGSDPKTFAIAWLRCDAAGAACAEIAGATGSGYALTGDEIGRTVRSRVTASNPAGSLARESAATAIVAATGGGPFAPGPPVPPDPGGPIPGATPDTAPPVLTVAFKRIGLKPLLRKGLRTRVSCSEACVITARLLRAKRAKRAERVSMLSAGSARATPARVPSPHRGAGARFRPRTPRQGGMQVIGRGSGRLSSAGQATIVVRLTPKVRRALKRARRLSAELRISATDGAGNRAATTRSLRARR
jgi:hypothetical protein